GPHRPQVNEAHVGIVPASRDPPGHSAPVPVDPVPHQIAHESADLAEAARAVELDHADGVFIAALFTDQLPILTKVGLAAARAEARVRFHFLDAALEIVMGDVKVQIELADVIEVGGVDGVVTFVESVDDAAAEFAEAAVFSRDDADPREAASVF